LTTDRSFTDGLPAGERRAVQAGERRAVPGR
jgi:hypothetical protein